MPRCGPAGGCWSGAGLTAARIPPPHGGAYTPAASTWTALRASPLRGRAGPVAVWTGRRMIVWGGSGRIDGAAYTPAPAAFSWGKAIGVPGRAALNTGAGAVVSSVSCGSPGSCTARGSYTDCSRHGQGFVTQAR